VEKLEHIKGVLTKIRFQNAEGNFAVAQIKDPTQNEVTIVGNICSAHIGEHLEITGSWIEHEKFGRQIKIETLQIILPTTDSAIQRYLSSGLIDGIGPALAERIVKKFGDKTLEIIDKEPQKIKEVDGIGKIRAAKIGLAWESQRSIRHVMVFLHDLGISANLATHIFKHYGPQALAIIRTNPYLLARDMYGIGFRRADDIARHRGLSADSPFRIQAGIAFLLRESRMEGHVFLEQEDLLHRAISLLAVDQGLVKEQTKTMVDAGDLIAEYCAGKVCLFLPALWESETRCAQHLHRLDQKYEVKKEALEKALKKVQKELDFDFADSQLRAIEKVWMQKITVISGGPGTGKTTIIRAICEIGKLFSRRILLCAPTGRAAKRLSEATQMPAQTIHRLLDYSFQEGGFQLDEDNPLDVDMLVVDESSMIDITLFEALLGALKEGSALLLVGDIDQLPSVGPGNVLGDIIDSKCIEVVRLSEIFRQAQGSKIVMNAHQVNRGLPLLISDKKGDFFTINASTPKEAKDKIVNLVTTRLPQAFGYHPFEDIQILSPMHKGEVGCSSLNQELQEALGDQEAPSLVFGKGFWRVGDKVMQTRNNYDLNIYNGDIGRLIEIDHQEECVGVMFDHRLVHIPFEQLDALILAYAITVHKSQGSQYPVVILPLLTQHYVMLQRNLLYTAITRAKALVVLVGSAKAVEIAIKNNDAKTRNTRLAWRLSQFS